MKTKTDIENTAGAVAPAATCSAIVRSLPKLPQSQRPLCDQISMLWAAANKLGLYDAADFLRPHMARPEENSGFAFPPQNVKEHAPTLAGASVETGGEG